MNTGPLPSYICVVLCGGAARRMQDATSHGLKIHLKVNNKTILDHIITNLEQALHPPAQIVLNLHASQVAHIQSPLPIVLDQFEAREGPLAGIAAGLSWCHQYTPNTEWVLIVSGDTPFLPFDLGHRLLHAASAKRSKIVYAQSKGRHHPTISMWHHSLLADLERQLDAGVRKVDHFSAPHKPALVNWQPRTDGGDLFMNINTLEEHFHAQKNSKRSI